LDVSGKGDAVMTNKPSTSFADVYAVQTAEIEKLREQNRRLKAAIARARKCTRYGWEDMMRTSDVLEALRLRK